MNAVHGRRAAILAALAVPASIAHADAIEDIAARANEAAAEASTPEAIAAKEAEDKAQEDSQLGLSLGVGGLIAVSTALSMQPVSSNVNRVAKKVRTGKSQARY